MRELAGLTQQGFADEMGVKILSIKRWESPKYPQQAPAEAWQFLDNLCTAAMASCSRALAQVASMALSDDVVLPYWASADEYEERHSDSDLTWTEANAHSRAAGILLFARGMRVTWASEDEATVTLF